MKIYEIIDEILPWHTHPNFRKRKKNLDEMTILDEFILDFNMQNMYIEEGVKDVLVSRIAKILKPLDKILSQNVKAIFPLV